MYNSDTGYSEVSFTSIMALRRVSYDKNRILLSRGVLLCFFHSSYPIPTTRFAFNSGSSVCKENMLLQN